MVEICVCETTGFDTTQRTQRRAAMNTDARRKVLHKRAVISYRNGQAETWVTCLAARRIVGKYENGATAALASDMCRSCASGWDAR